MYRAQVLWLTGKVWPRNCIWRNSSSTATHWPTGHCRKAPVTTARRSAGGVNLTPLAVWPLMISTRLSSSGVPLSCQRWNSDATTSAGGCDRALLPRGVRVSLLPSCFASPPACRSNGQAKGRIGRMAPPAQRSAPWSSAAAYQSPPSRTDSMRATAAALGRPVLGPTVTPPWPTSRSTASRSCRIRGSVSTLRRGSGSPWSDGGGRLVGSSSSARVVKVNAAGRGARAARRGIRSSGIWSP